MAGLIGGAVIAVWFFIFDTVDGRPLWSRATLPPLCCMASREPAVLTQTAWALVAEYTVRSLPRLRVHRRDWRVADQRREATIRNFSVRC